MSMKAQIPAVIGLCAMLVGCDTGPGNTAGPETITLPSVEEFDRIIVQLPPYRPAFANVITSSEVMRELNVFLEAYGSGWLVPAFGTYDNETRVELYDGARLVEVLYVGQGNFERYYFARERGDIYVRRVDEKDVISGVNPLDARKLRG
ncbi:MAG: hypothetical protein R3288_07160 [Woeseiaceae bacterium]|nr:hypothetical protein [Woeseiaceae bacterium]